jgi:hypothetical protein
VERVFWEKATDGLERSAWVVVSRSAVPIKNASLNAFVATWSAFFGKRRPMALERSAWVVVSRSAVPIKNAFQVFFPMGGRVVLTFGTEKIIRRNQHS